MNIFRSKFFTNRRLINPFRLGCITIVYLFLLMPILLPAGCILAMKINIKHLKEPMKKNYELHQKEIADLKQYFESITDDSTEVDIEFDGKNIRRLCTRPYDNYRLYSCLYDLDKKEYIIEAVGEKVGWNKEILENLRKKLKAANCISISSIVDQGTEVGFKRSGFGMYYYRVFDKDLTAKEIEDFNDGCTYSYYRNNVVLEYGGAAFGSAQCFEDFSGKRR